jgi:hypothetical protein
MTLSTGTRLEGYEVLESISGGGMMRGMDQMEPTRDTRNSRTD